MDASRYMILIKGEIKTGEISFCRYNHETYKYDIQFCGGQKYSYSCQNVKILREPVLHNPNLCRLSREGRILFDVKAIYEFQDGQQQYWHICFENGSARDYNGDELRVEQSCLTEAAAQDVMSYLKQIASLGELKNDAGENLLKKQYENLGYIGKETALAVYLNPNKMQFKEKRAQEAIPIFPFGCNQSQYNAVKRALENKVSVIQGPPGTGKTQTILNIIANVLIAGKNVLVVSNNNSATENVYEKLASPKYNMGFLVAALGNAENKSAFIKKQKGYYPDIREWELDESRKISRNEVRDESLQLHAVFEKQERLAVLKQELAQLEVEIQYFHQYLDETDVDINRIQLRKNVSAAVYMDLWQECQMISDREKKIGLLFKLKSILQYGISDWKFYQQEMSKIITSLQGLFYQKKRAEIRKEIQGIEESLKNAGNVSAESMCEKSMQYFKDALYGKYGNRQKRRIFSEEDLWKNPQDFMREYPVMLSTTFSARSSLGKNLQYDYLIMDEASQVDVATGALALSCARNVVIVGDTRQLPNVVTEDIKKRAQTVFNSFQIKEGYSYTKSFLQSVLDVIPDVPQTLLREHYRCHPKIINFCNQKFYRGELLIMTEDKGEKDVLSVIRTTEGNHERDHYSQRQIDVIKKEVLPRLSADLNEIGIIAPYKNQVNAMVQEIEGIDIATVHKFQGKEKDTVIISTVDDEITDFADDPYLLNVAVSRAKKKLCIVVSGNEQSADRNISDLISYVKYNNFEIRKSQIYSVFDYLYKQYTKSRYEYLKKHKRISELDSENLMYALVTDVLQEDRYAVLDVVCHLPLNMLIRNPELLNDEECAYAMNPATHLDFLIFNRISKQPILAIEVDGYQFHKEGTRQAQRDRLKDRILELYQIPLQRFATNGSCEKEKLVERLDAIK